MESVNHPQERADASGIDIAFVLLLMQGAFALVSALGVLAFVVLSGAVAVLGGSLILTAGTAVLALVLASGVARLKRWARTGVLLFEWLTMAGGGINFIVQFLQLQTLPGLVPLLTSLAIPMAVVALLMQPAVRAAFVRPPRQKKARTQRAATLVWVADHPMPVSTYTTRPRRVSA
jgi:hypothetical protein